MGESITISLPRRELAEELVPTLAEHGLRAEIVDGGEEPSLRVVYASRERDRLVGDATGALEAFLADRMLPLIVEPAAGGCVLRPPAD